MSALLVLLIWKPTGKKEEKKKKKTRKMAQIQKDNIE